MSDELDEKLIHDWADDTVAHIALFNKVKVRNVPHPHPNGGTIMEVQNDRCRVKLDSNGQLKWITNDQLGQWETIGQETRVDHKLLFEQRQQREAQAAKEAKK